MQILQSKIILAKNIKIDKNYINVIDYSESNMVNLCSNNSHLVASRNDYQFIRSNGTIYVDIPYATCLEANYIAFQNKDYSNKWFFAWIDEVIFNSDKNAEIRYTIDQWSTWHDYWSQKPCYVLREHVNDDTIGLHTIPENLDVGEMVEQDIVEINNLATDLWIVIESEFDPLTNDKFSGISMVNGQFQAYPYYFIPYTLPLEDNSTYSNLSNFLLCVATGGGGTFDRGNIAYIKNIFVVPKVCVPQEDLTFRSIAGTSAFNTFAYYEARYVAGFEEENVEKNVYKLHEFSDNNVVVPIKNNKCYCYPYNYLFVSNNIGNYNIYKYEDFSNYDNATFKLMLSTTIGASGSLVPTGYKGMANDWDETLPLAKFPTFSWSSDAFTNWLTQNALNMATSIVGLGGNATQSATNEIVASESGAISGAGAIGIGLSVASGIANTIGAFYSASLLPNIKGGQNTGDVNFSAGINTFCFRQMRCKTEYIKRIDDYFTRFGYKIDRLKNANLTGRNIFNYVEIGSNESIGQGSLPSVAMETINNAFRRGVTIWHLHENVGNYNLNNSII